MEAFVVAALVLMGILLFLVEFFLIPGVTIAGIGGFLSVTGGVFLAYKYFGPTTGTLVMVGSFVMVILALIKALRGNTWKKIGLNTQITSHVNEPETPVSVGGEGNTISRLSPSGKARFGDEIYEVHSIEGYIDHGKNIVISHVKNNKIYVKLK